MENKKLYRSTKDRKFMGVCGGLAEYFNIDATLIRVLWAVLSICAALGIVAYIVCCFVIPEEPTNTNYNYTGYNNGTDNNQYTGYDNNYDNRQ